MGPRDGAFVFVSPRAGPQSEAALADIVDKASGRPVVLINPRLGQSAALRGFMPAYLIRPLSVTYLEDAMATEASRASACAEVRPRSPTCQLASMWLLVAAAAAARAMAAWLRPACWRGNTSGGRCLL